MPGDSKNPKEGKAVLDLAFGLARGLEGLLAREARAANLKQAPYALLVEVASGGEDGLSVSEAAARLGVRSQALAPLARELEQEGLLTREVDQSDRRSRRLKANRAGQERVASGQKVRQKATAAVAFQIPHAAVASLVLRRIATALVQSQEA